MNYIQRLIDDLYGTLLEISENIIPYLEESIEDKFQVGNVAVIGETEDDDLNEFLDTFGNRIVITEIEMEDGEPTGNFWGVQVTNKVHCPYHLEYSDIVNIDSSHFDISKFEDFKDVEMNEDGEFVEV